MFLLYGGKEKIHSETGLIIYQFKWYSLTGIISLALLVLFTQPLRSSMIWHKVNFKRSLTGLNSEFSFSYTSCLTKAEEPSLSYYLPIAGGRIIGFIPFPRVLVLCEMQSVSSRIWTRVAVSNSYDDNHYTTGTSSLALLVLRPKLVLLLTDVLQSYLSTSLSVTASTCLRITASFILPRYRKSRSSSHHTTVPKSLVLENDTWNHILYTNYKY